MADKELGERGVGAVERALPRVVDLDEPPRPPAHVNRQHQDGVQAELAQDEGLALVEVLVRERHRARQAALEHVLRLRVVVDEEHPAGVELPRRLREARVVDERAVGQPGDGACGRAQQHGEMPRRRLQHAFLRPLAAERTAGVPELAQGDVAEAALAHALAQLPVEEVEARPARTGRPLQPDGLSSPD